MRNIPKYLQEVFDDHQKEKIRKRILKEEKKNESVFYKTTKKYNEEKMKIFVVGQQGAGRGTAAWIKHTNTLGVINAYNIHDYVDSIREADLILFTGGGDVDPILYGQKNERSRGISESRDVSEVNVYKTALRLNKPMFGICRGFQFLAIMNGATLYQDVNKHNGDHEVITGDNRVFETTSVHHQMVNLTDLKEEDYRILMVTSENGAPKCLAGYHIDAHPDGGIRYCNPKYEVEAAFFPKTRSLGCQGHPEYATATEDFKKEINDYIHQLLLGNASSSS
jgi:gamma-glutamyl-gamma-aminobutyrate hydrolase PuuD